MSIRKEQVLLIIVVLLAALVARGYFGEAPRVPTYRPTRQEFEEHKVEPAPLVDRDASGAMRGDFMTEPSETRPLPPRDLPFPPRDALSLVGLPLDPGPDYRHSWLLRLDGEQVQGAVVQAGGGAGGDGAAIDDGGLDEGGGDGTQGPTAGVMPEAQAAKLYDQIRIGVGKPFYGLIEADAGVDLFELEKAGTDFSKVELRMLVFNRTKRKFNRTPTRFGEAGGHQKIVSIHLKDTLRNEVTRQVRAVPQDASYQGERQTLINWLLEQAKQEAWIYDEALKQAQIFFDNSGKTLGGYRVMQRVLRARGDLDGELALLEGITGDPPLQSFRLQGLGVMKARLGLWIEAEQNLRQAVDMLPTDARPHAELASFLLARGRSEDALAAARRAQETIGSVQNSKTRSRIMRIIFSAHLAMGDTGNQVRNLVQAEGPALGYLLGCLAYAQGEFGSAIDNFQRVTSGLDTNAARLGQAACLVATGKWQEAHDLFQRVADEDPLLRHRALTGLALLFSRINQFESALTYVDRALEAAPNDPYALYLRGRTLRLMGQYPGAEQALTDLLKVRDDFVHAIAEMAAAQSGLASVAAAEDQAEKLLSARRYMDRAVALAPEPRLELYELQGLHAFAAADWRAARAAFEKARGLTDDPEKEAWSKGALAVVAYSRNRVDGAATDLERLRRDLGRESALGGWADATLVSIYDHAEKESLSDSFDRDKPGQIWADDADGRLRAKIANGMLTFDENFSRTGNGEVSTWRVDAVPRGKNFLAVSAKVELGDRHEVEDSFVGLGIEVRRGRQGVDLQARVGLYSGLPHVSIIDGRQSGRQEAQLIKPSPDLLYDDKPQELELRVVPRGEESSRQLLLQVWFNGAPVHSHELKTLTTSTSGELLTQLFATGNKGAQVEVRFDDYELQRRKDKR